MPPDHAPEAAPLRPATQATRPAVSIVIPVFNESAALPRFSARLRPVLERLDRPAEVIYVDDGSTDRSLEELLVIQGQDPGITVVALARNAGQHAAIVAGF